MNLRLTLNRKEAIALRDAMALSSRHCDYDFTLDRIERRIQRGHPGCP